MTRGGSPLLSRVLPQAHGPSSLLPDDDDDDYTRCDAYSAKKDHLTCFPPPRRVIDWPSKIKIQNCTIRGEHVAT